MFGRKAVGAAFGVAWTLWRMRTMAPGRKRERRAPMTPATNPRNPADAAIGPAGRNLENRLDEGIEESFPASDPVSVHIE
ncbi:MAG TPA: hypothetical protein PLL69_00095 [Gemmatimonadales bacterium]|nr:hypothetical protein [Gemmatimonadales bacterium]